MSKNILVADDAAIMRLLLRNILSNAGYNVVGEAADGKEAVRRYQELKPDLVTMDITMPGMNGIEAVKSIKTIDPSAKIIMCSAMGQKSMVFDAIEAGAINFIVKPFDEPKVMEAIEKALSL